ncbi:MAG: DUF1476 domain-containing protein [Hyphomicrobiaceae bacterium]|nr:DUF1476 domain-containing protein [Hyphomicrobiaceae bacterium]MCC0024846.1 DUF1476 domain-containing protein [Hyphomicrobiaceae bacterium]
MSSFDDREKAQEAKYMHDEAVKFKATARRNKMLGHWAADLMGHENPDAYAGEVVAADFEEAGDEDVVRKVVKDLQEKGIAVGADEVRAKLATFLSEAIAELASDPDA